MVVFGIDPGLHFFGWGTIKVEKGNAVHIGNGVITVPQNLSVPQRLLFLEENLSQLMAKYQPARVIVERAFFSKNADSAFKLGLVRGIALKEAARFNCEVREYAARAVKKGIAGHGNADKETVAVFVSRLLSLRNPIPTDASDALALALYGASMCDKEELMSARGIEI